MKNETKCKVTRSCIYGGNAGVGTCCNYLLITGELRGEKYPIKNGRCDAYKRGKKLHPKKSPPSVSYRTMEGYKEV